MSLSRNFLMINFGVKRKNLKVFNILDTKETFSMFDIHVVLNIIKNRLNILLYEVE